MNRLEQNERLEDLVRSWFMAEDGESYIGAFHCFEAEEVLEDMITMH